MASPVDVQTLRNIAFVAMGLSLMACAAYLNFQRPASLASRLLALAVFFAGLDLLFVLQYWPALAAHDRLAAAFRWFMSTTRPLTILSAATFLYVYPVRPRWRSWTTLLWGYVAVTTAGGATIAAFVPRATWETWRPALPLIGETPFYYIFMGGTLLTLLLLVLVWSSLLRARHLPDPQRGAAWLIAPLLMAGWFAWASLELFWAVDEGAYHYHYLIRVGGGNPLMVTTVFLASYAPFLVMAWLAWQRRWVVPGMAMMVTAAMFLPGRADLPIVEAGVLLLPIAVVYSINRHGFAGLAPLGGVGRVVWAVILGLSAFLVVNASILRMYPDTDLALSWAVFLGGAAAAACATVIVRSGHADVAPGRLDAYRAALEAELAEGGGGSHTRLGMMRDRLGISQKEHAAMIHVLRSQRGQASRPSGLRPGDLFLDRYKIRESLGQGAAGCAYLVHDRHLHRTVVIKALRPMAGGSLEASLKEARAMAGVEHPNIVRILDVEQLGDEGMLVMQHVAGGTLLDRLAQGPVRGHEFARLAGGLLAGLSALHERDMVHRDVKPSNILLTPDGAPKLGDLGIVHVPGYESTMLAFGMESAVGTVAYMSPEAARGWNATPAADVYSAAATLCEAWTGRRLLEARPGESVIELQMRAASRTAAPKIRAPAALAAWLRRGLEPTPGKRFATANDMARAMPAKVTWSHGATHSTRVRPARPPQSGGIGEAAQPS